MIEYLKDKKTMSIVSLIFIAVYFIGSLFIYKDTLLVNFISSIIISFTYTGSFIFLICFLILLFNKNKQINKVANVVILIQTALIFIFSSIRIFSGYISSLDDFLNNPGSLEALIYSLITLIVLVNFGFLILSKTHELPIKLNTMLIIILILCIFGFLKTSVNMLELGSSSYIYLYIFISTIPVVYSLFLEEQKEYKNSNKNKTKLEY